MKSLVWEIIYGYFICSILLLALVGTITICRSLMITHTYYIPFDNEPDTGCVLVKLLKSDNLLDGLIWECN